VSLISIRGIPEAMLLYYGLFRTPKLHKTLMCKKEEILIGKKSKDPKLLMKIVRLTPNDSGSRSSTQVRYTSLNEELILTFPNASKCHDIRVP
jgi:hypothetical protein